MVSAFIKLRTELLVEDEDWTTEGKRVVLSNAALLKLQQHLKLAEVILACSGAERDEGADDSEKEQRGGIPLEKR